VTPEERYDALVDAFIDRPGVSCDQEPGFGSGALKVDRKIFAMLTRGRLIVKLPRERVSALVASGEGEPFDANKGRPMKEWLTVSERNEQWAEIADEARQFVASKR